MCNEHSNNSTTSKPIKDYRFIDYRLNQLEISIKTGMEKLEKEQDNNYKELIKMLQIVQQNNNKQNETLVEIVQRQQTVEDKLKDIDKIKEVLAVHSEQIVNLNNRINIYKQIMIGIIIAVAASFLMALIQLI